MAAESNTSVLSMHSASMIPPPPIREQCAACTESLQRLWTLSNEDDVPLYADDLGGFSTSPDVEINGVVTGTMNQAKANTYNGWVAEHDWKSILHVVHAWTYKDLAHRAPLWEAGCLLELDRVVAHPIQEPGRLAQSEIPATDYYRMFVQMTDDGAEIYTVPEGLYQRVMTPCKNSLCMRTDPEYQRILLNHL